MNKKGFTLVELLAVIAILAVLVIIALPNVMGMFNNAKKSAFTTELKEVYKVAQQTWVGDSLFSTGEKVYSKCSGCTGKPLDLTGRDNLEYYIKIDKSGKVSEFYATDGTYQFQYEGNLLDTYIKDVEVIADLKDTGILTIKNDEVLVDGGPANMGRLCVVKEKDYNSDKVTLYYKKGTTIQQWMTSSENRPGFTLGGYIDTNNNYIDVTDATTDIHNADEGCYYPKMVEACVMSDYAKETVSGSTMSRVKTTFEIPENIKVTEYENSIFKTQNVNYSQFLRKTGLFTTDSATNDIMYDSTKGCYFNGEILTTGTTVRVYIKNQYTKECTSNQTVGECLQDSEIGGLELYYGSKGVSYGHNYSLSPMLLVEPGQKYYTTYGLVCIDGESEVEVYDRKKKKKLKKKLKDVTYDDLILCWDFDKGEYTYQKPVWIMKQREVTECMVLKFSDGTTLKIAGNGFHRIYNLDKQMFTSCKFDEETPVGMRTINNKGEVITLVSKEIVKENITICNVVTYKDINIYANGILTSRGSNNLYKIDNMKFVKDDRETLSREDLPDVSNDIYYGLRLGERDIALYGSKENAIKELTALADELEELK